ncbi:pyridoxamine 5'-phosphate oxidase family protein [Clostridium omnivorum]|uniref:MFS transporter n=1 Tax=Clostridium omnivorum TaxID=1604902 RepID=A0ABQ5N0S3_9CLOT|nr:pyridoxamine 5'-phosphate oxidase family protein [Clostridium sp. E14]GLC28773.1 MFS transporter [Clostridium sp. E14]
MFREMRKKQREITEEESIEILNNGEYGILATIGENGYTYATPLSYVYYNDAIYFHCAVEGSKLDNIKYNEKVSFCVVGKTKVLPDKFSTEYESAIVFGRATIIEKEEKIEILTALIEKYSPDFKKEGLEYIERAAGATSVVKIGIDRITGKARR